MIRSRNHGRMVIPLCLLVTSLVLAVVASGLHTPAVANSGFASFDSCVYERATGRPIEGALVFVQALDSANGNGTYTGPDGCISPKNAFNVESFFGDYIQAEYVLDGRVYVQQFRIPNRLLPQVYRRDFFLDLPRRGDSRHRP